MITYESGIALIGCHCILRDCRDPRCLAEENASRSLLQSEKFFSLRRSRRRSESVDQKPDAADHETNLSVDQSKGALPARQLELERSPL